MRAFLIGLIAVFSWCEVSAQSLPGPLGGGNETTTGAQILAKSVNISCLSWSPIGICVWLDCGFTGCSINTSIKVKHYSPDVTVTSYNALGRGPWLETRPMAVPTPFAQDGGSAKESSSVGADKALLFKNVDVIGSPGTAWIRALASAGLFCDPSTIPYRPYFISTLDPFWRDPLVETPLSIANIFRNVGTLTNSWSPLYPRIGFIHQGHDYKASAVAAQRAADIVTRSGQPHIYNSINADSARGYWPAGEIREGDADTGKWQQLVPSGGPSGCITFPDINDQLTAAFDPFSSRLNQSTGNAFNLWRPYRCCQRRGQSLLFHTGN